jgi:hypothetical protein
MIAKEITNIILNIVFIATFIAIFFFTYGATVEQSVIKEQVDYAVNDLIGNVKFFLSPQELELLNNYIDQIKPPDMSAIDKAAADHNKKLIIDASILMGILLIVGIIISIVLALVFKFNIGKVIGLNFIILIFIALTEFSFLTFLGKRYRSLDPNFITETMLVNLKSFATS